jgi:hypothetical protein
MQILSAAYLRASHQGAEVINNFPGGVDGMQR